MGECYLAMGYESVGTDGKIFRRGLILGINSDNPAILSQENAFEYWDETVLKINFLEEIWKRGKNV